MSKVNKSKFELLEIPPLEMYVGKDQITFTKKVVDRLGKPDYMLYLYDEETNSFAVQACKEGEVSPFRFCYGRTEKRSSVVIMSTHLLRQVRDLMGEEWKNKRYVIRGKYDKEQNFAIFDLTKARDLHHELKNGRWVRKKQPKSAKQN